MKDLMSLTVMLLLVGLVSSYSNASLEADLVPYSDVYQLLDNDPPSSPIAEVKGRVEKVEVVETFNDQGVIVSRTTTIYCDSWYQFEVCYTTTPQDGLTTDGINYPGSVTSETLVS